MEDSLLVFLKSSLGVNFAMLASSDDDIATLKTKAETQFLELFPHSGGIRAQAIKKPLNGRDYTLGDSSCVSLFTDRAKRSCSFLLDAIELPSISAQTHSRISQHCDTSSSKSKDLIDGGGNPSCINKSSKMKSLKVGTDKDVVIEEDFTVGLEEELTVAIENETIQTIRLRLKKGSSLAGSPGNASSHRDLIKEEGNSSCTSVLLKKKLFEDDTSENRALEEVVNLGVDIMGQCAQDKGINNKCNELSSDEIPNCNERESSRTGDQIKESSAASENKSAGLHLKIDSSPACTQGNASSNRDLTEGEGNPSCTYVSLKRKSLEDDTNEDMVLEEEVTLGVDIMVQCAQDKGNNKKPKELSTDEVPNCNMRESSRIGDQVKESTADSENKSAGMYLKIGSSPAGTQGNASSHKDLIEGEGTPSCTSVSSKRKSLEDDSNEDMVLKEEVALGVDITVQCAQDKGNNKKSKVLSIDGVPNCNDRESSRREDEIKENSVASEDNSYGVHLKIGSSPRGTPGIAFSDGEGVGNPSCTSVSLKRKSLEDDTNEDRTLEEEVTVGVDMMGQCSQDKGSNNKFKELSSDEGPICNERESSMRGDQIKESCASENESAGVHLKIGSSPTGTPDLLSEDMPKYNAHSLGHLAKQLACTASDKGKAKFHPDVRSSRSCIGSTSANYKMPDTHKTIYHGVTLHKPCIESEATRVESSDQEGRKSLSCEKHMTMEELGLTSEDLEDQIAIINQINSDELFARSLQDEFNREYQIPDGSYREISERLLQISEHRRAQMRFSGPEMDHENLLLSQLVHELSLPQSQIDHDKKQELLNELIATYDSRAEMDLSDGFHFYGDLFYDEDEDDAVPNQNVGASEIQINHLPVSEIKAMRIGQIVVAYGANLVLDILVVIQDCNENNACTICLETPTVGSVVRHLPCLHKFHKECIDKWLRIKNSCPVCKLAID